MKLALEFFKLIPGLRAGILFGSRARGTDSVHSDWDLILMVTDVALATKRPFGVRAWCVRGVKDGATHVTGLYPDENTVLDCIFLKAEEFYGPVEPPSFKEIQGVCYPFFKVLVGDHGFWGKKLSGATGEYRLTYTNSQVEHLHEAFLCDLVIAKNLMANSDREASVRMSKGLHDINQILLYEIYRRLGLPSRQKLKKLKSWIIPTDLPLINPTDDFGKISASHEQLLERLAACPLKLS